MSFWEWLALLVASIGTGASILGLLLGRASRFNGEATRTLIKEEGERSRELLAEIRATTERGDLRTQELLREIREGNERGDQRTQELLREIREGNERGDQHTQVLIREVHQDTMRVLDKIAERVSR